MWAMGNARSTQQQKVKMREPVVAEKTGKHMYMVHVFESTLEWTSGEVIVNSGIGSNTSWFFFEFGLCRL
jgi:hypothetical protein